MGCHKQSLIAVLASDTSLSLNVVDERIELSSALTISLRVISDGSRGVVAGVDRYVAEFVCVAADRHLPDLQSGNRLRNIQPRSMGNGLPESEGEN